VKISENILKWMMRLYPPFLLQRIWVQKIYKGFSGADIKINRSLLTLNFGKAIFGGTIYAAIDPFYALLFGQLLKNKNYNITVWLKSASIKFLKPGRCDLYYSIRITEEMIKEVEMEINANGVFVKSYTIEIYSKTGELHAIAKNEIYIKKK
jgi:hypothetical protein